MSIDLYRAHESVFQRYQSLLLKWNDKINLTAITASQDIVEKHFLDSLALVDVSRETFFQENVSRETFSVLDIGSGGGFPGIPLKIALPSLRLTLVDALKKRCDFLKEVARALSLKEVTVLQETLNGQSIGCFDAVVTRATFSLANYLSIALPNLKPHGVILAMKSLDIADEMNAAERLLPELGLKPFEVKKYQLPYSLVQRQVLLTRR